MKKDLFIPDEVEQVIQRDVTSIISSTPSRKKVKRLLPKIRKIEAKLKKRNNKVELRRLLKE